MKGGGAALSSVSGCGFTRCRSRSRLFGKAKFVSTCSLMHGVKCLTAHEPATLATIPLLIIIGRTPLVLLKMAPLSAPATTLFVISCFPLQYPIVLLMPLYTIAITPAEFPKNGPLRVTAFSTPLSRNRGAIVGGFFCKPSASPHAPPTDRADR